MEITATHAFPLDTPPAIVPQTPEETLHPFAVELIANRRLMLRDALGRSALSFFGFLSAVWLISMTSIGSSMTFMERAILQTALYPLIVGLQFVLISATTMVLKLSDDGVAVQKSGVGFRKRPKAPQFHPWSEITVADGLKGTRWYLMARSQSGKYHSVEVYLDYFSKADQQTASSVAQLCLQARGTLVRGTEASKAKAR